MEWIIPCSFWIVLRPKITAIFGWYSNNYTSLWTEYDIQGREAKSPLQKTRVPMVLDSMSMPQNYFLMLLLCCQLACFWYLQGINLISVTFCSDTDSGCQSTLLNPSSEHNSSPKQTKPSLSLGLTKPCHCSIWGIALPAFTAAAQEFSVSTSSHSSLKV